MKKLGWLAAAAIILIMVGYGIFGLFNPHSETPPLQKHAQWGAYAGEADDFLALEQQVGKTANIAATFVGFTEDFPDEFVSSVGSPTTTPLIFLETPDGSTLRDVINGNYDDTLLAFAKKAQAFGKPLILVPFNEPNLNESAWGFGTSPENTAGNFKLAWAHVHNLFKDAPNVKWGLAYNNVSIPDEPGNTFESLYPGETQVDYVGIDGFNWQEDGQWQDFADTMGSTTQELMQFKKPIYIFSVGTGEDTAGNPALKAAWISDMFSWIKSHPEVAGFVWFNEDKSSQGEKNWLIDSNPSAFDAFKAGIEQL
jgi:hypothetical protein